MGTPDLDVRDDGSFVVEAPTAEAALEAVREKFGPEANIVDAELVQSKGLAGFFSKQLYRVRVLAEVARPLASPGVSEGRRSGPEDAATATPSAGPSEVVPLDDVGREVVPLKAVPLKAMSLMAAPATEPVEQAVDVVLRRVEAGEDTGTRSFGEALHAELAARGVRPALDAEIASGDPRLREMVVQRDRVVSGTVDVRDGAPFEPAQFPGVPPLPSLPEREALPVPPPVAMFSHRIEKNATRHRATGDRGPLGGPAGEWAPGAGPVLWSLEHLSAVGLSPDMISDLAELDPADDLGWVYRLSEAVSPLCGPMPDEALLLVGRDIGAASFQMGIEAVSCPEAPSHEGDAAISTGPAGSSALAYIGHVQAGRSLHVVCDGTGWVETVLRHEQIGLTVRVVSTTRLALGEALRAVAPRRDGVFGYFVDADALIRVTPFELALGVRSLMPRA